MAEGAFMFAKGILMPTAPLKATFKRIHAPSIPRSSHTVSVIKGRVYIFGGEVAPRQPVDNAMHVIILPTGDLTVAEADYTVIEARPVIAGGEVPPARVGHTASVLGNRILIHGGRGGPEMKALEEKGRVWIFDTDTNAWSYLDSNPESCLPPPADRSYHASVASEQPLPSAVPNIANVLLDEQPKTTDELSGPPDPNTFGTFFLHAGCLSGGGRANDLWAFDIASRSWAEMPSAPGKPRGGTSLAMTHTGRERIYRYGGFDGETELGGQVDWLDLNSGTFNDKSGMGQMALSPRGTWHSNIFPGAATSSSDAEPAAKTPDLSNSASKTSYPPNRSVAGLVPVTTGQGREYLLVFFGETTPSNSGHEGAGKFLSDVWSFQLKPEGMTAASIKDATRTTFMHKDTGEAECFEVRYHDEDGKIVQEGQSKPMGARGWFGAASCGDYGGGESVCVWGGLSEGNERLGDGWIISVE